MPRRTRLIATAGLLLTLATAAGLRVLDRPGPPEPPAPWPIHATDITYTGISRPADRQSRSFSFTLRAEATSRTPVTVETLRQGYRSLRTHVTPRLPTTLRSGHPHRITVTMTVRSCKDLPLDAGLPFLDVTLRNVRARQEISEILGAAYAHDLTQALRTICRPTPAPRHSGTAHSHHPVTSFRGDTGSMSPAAPRSGNRT
ncbi:hypothetical protein [Streptomyces meridianus]|uniref:Tat pathway signal sequence domain protein n=1 Tax=Streptomyces meridianus TaxID=2938945 RepID=A0ABT0X4D7_9ACTN|nr:hypothetical protein [Streptomyces meridianus]MCM2576527.1 hypothetical protein [Streptomyces meridianus]